MALLARRHWQRIPAGVWLDGIVAGLGIATVGAGLVFGPVLRASSGSFVAVATNLAYPIGDLLLAALVVGILALRGWRLDCTWGLLGGGFLVLTVADSIYLLQVSSGSATSSNVANLFYMTGVALLALAAWQPSERPARPHNESLSTLVVPGVFALAALGVLAYDHVHEVDGLAFGLSLATVLAALLRTTLAFRDLRTFDETRRQALTDDLTALPNRRLFQRRLQDAIRLARHGGDGMAVVIVDLDGFKELNDTLGHQSGDELLRQIGPRLATALRPTDLLARLGGDEFGIVLEAASGEESARAVAAKLRKALADPFEVQDLTLRVDASFGVALFPEHANTAGELLRRATSRCTRPRTAGSARPSTPRTVTRTRASGSRSPPSSSTGSAATRSSSTSSRRPTRAPVRSSAWRRSSAGGTPSTASCRRTTSSRSPRRPA